MSNFRLRRRIGQDLLAGMVIVPLWYAVFPTMPWWGWLILGATISMSTRLRLEGRL